MQKPARNIWDTKIQCVCSVVSARQQDDTEFWFCANYGQVGQDPPRLIINPNLLYPIAAAIREQRRFAVNVFAASQWEAALRVMRIRRRALRKAEVLGMRVAVAEEHDIPYLPECQLAMLCEAEEFLETGDHQVIVGRVVERRQNAALSDELPLLYPALLQRQSSEPALVRGLRWGLHVTGLRDRVERVLAKRRGPAPPADVAAETYQSGGQTMAEVEEITRHGVRDEGRVIEPPPRAPAALRRKLPVCVVGIGEWGAHHCRIFQYADPNVELYVCGRDPERVASFARRVGAVDGIVGLERAVEDKRFAAMSLVLPHHMHASAAQMAAAAGKHVLVEKPIANTLADASAMIDAARRAGTILMVAEDMHFRPVVGAAARAVQAGDIGEPLYLQANAGGMLRPKGWKTDPSQMGGGVMMDLGVHYVRALRLLMGEPERVLATRAMQIYTKMAGEDSGSMLFASRYGWRAHLLLNWAGPRGHSPDLIVSGESGVLHLWPGRRYYDLYPAAQGAVNQMLSFVRPASLGERFMKPEYDRVRRITPETDAQGYLSEVREFLACVAEERVPCTAPEDGRRDVQIVLCAYASLWQDAWVSIPQIEPSTVAGVGG